MSLLGTDAVAKARAKNITRKICVKFCVEVYYNYNFSTIGWNVVGNELY